MGWQMIIFHHAENAYWIFETVATSLTMQIFFHTVFPRIVVRVHVEQHVQHNAPEYGKNIFYKSLWFY